MRSSIYKRHYNAIAEELAKIPTKDGYMREALVLDAMMSVFKRFSTSFDQYKFEEYYNEFKERLEMKLRQRI